MYSCGAMNSTTAWFKSGRCHLSRDFWPAASQSKACGTSFVKLHILHLHLWPWSRNVTKGLMYDRHLRHRLITWSGTTGIGSSASWSEVYGWMTSAKGNFDFFRREWVVGTALSVDRTNLGGQLAYGEGVTLVYQGLASEAASHA